MGIKLHFLMIVWVKSQDGEWRQVVTSWSSAGEVWFLQDNWEYMVVFWGQFWNEI